MDFPKVIFPACLLLLVSTAHSQFHGVDDETIAIREQFAQHSEWERFYRETADEERAGEIEKAFRGYLSVPGGEQSALQLFKKKPEICEPKLKEILSEREDTPSRIRSLLLLADSEMGKIDPEFALNALRKFVSRIAKPRSEKGWNELAVPYDYYPVERSTENGAINVSLVHSSRNAPFQSGSGGYTDNWLIRRFIALGAWDDATTEFQRIAALHAEKTEKAGSPSPVALEFALEYSFYLNERKRFDEAQSYLLLTFLGLDIEWTRESRGYSPLSYGTSSGISVDDFIRLGYGALKEAGREEELVTVLKNSVNPAALRVLAGIESHRKNAKEALALELKYIDEKNFSAVSREFRKGKVYARFAHHKKAAIHFENAFSLPQEERPDLPPAPLDSGYGYSSIGHSVPFQGDIATRLKLTKSGLPPINYRPLVLDELEKIYQALGRSEKVVTTRLRIWDENPSHANQFDQVQSLTSLAATTLLSHEFRKWAKASEPKLAPEARANVSWALRDYEGTITALAGVENLYDFDTWLKRFEKVEDGKLVVPFLEAMTDSHPDKSKYALLLLKYSGEQTSDEKLVELYEKEFLPDVRPAFKRDQGKYDEAAYQGFHDLADRLMRLYHNLGRIEEMEQLGLRMARNEEPFSGNGRGRTDNEDDERAMAFLISHAGEETLRSLDSILTSEDWPRGRPHLDWVLAGGVAGTIGKFQERKIPPSNLPENVEVLVSYQNVLDLARNETHLFAGFPWGVGVYDFDGKLLRRIFIEDAALRLAANETELWIGTALGLRQVDLKSWELSQLRIDQERSEETRARKDYNFDFYNGVTGLAIIGDTLWIGSRQNVRKLDLETRELRIFSQTELGVDSHSDWEWFLVQEDGKVWANSGDGESRRYDPATDSWTVPDSEVPGKSLRLLGRIDGQLWANTFISEAVGWRPGLLDPATLEVEPIGFSRLTLMERKEARPLALFGKSGGKIIFGRNSPEFALDKEHNELDEIDEPWKLQLELEGHQIPVEFSHTEKVFRHDGAIKSSGMTALPLPDGRVVLGDQRHDSSRYLYPERDWPFGDFLPEDEENRSGLSWLENGKPVHKTPARGLGGDTVFDVVPAEEGYWLATNAGISLVNERGMVIGNFGRDHGLPGNYATDVQTLNGQTWFACHFWDREGGLIGFDRESSLFRTYTTANGLSSNHVASLVPKDDRLEIVYGSEYWRHAGSQLWQFPPSEFHPATGAFSPRTEPKLTTRGKREDPADRVPTPFVGGSTISESVIEGKRWQCGTRGVVILPESGESLFFSAGFPKLEVSILSDTRVQWLAEARRIRKDNSPSLSEKWNHENPFVVADALSEFRNPLSPEHFEVVVSKLGAEVVELRSTAAVLLSREETPEAVAALRQVKKDPIPAIRALATLAIAKHDDDLPTDALVEIYRADGVWGNPKFGAESSIGFRLDGEKVVEVLSQRGHRIDAEAIRLLMQFPDAAEPPYDEPDSLEPFGKALIRNPQLISILLDADDTRKNKYTDRSLARDIFAQAGPALLPALHEALASDDRIIRANAALACGAIGDQSSIKPLITAMDLESGLSKGTIVTALGELRAKEILPLLGDLYREAKAAEERRYQSGMQYAQIGVQSRQTFRKIENLRVDWDEIKTTTEEAAAPADPNWEEALLSPRIILEAVEEIGPEHAQPFYRSIAADANDYDGASAASIHLAAAAESEKEASVQSLRILATGNNRAASVNALVSLLLLGDRETAHPAIIRHLKSEDKAPMLNVLSKRIEDRKLLGFAKEALQEIRNNEPHFMSLRDSAVYLLKGI